MHRFDDDHYGPSLESACAKAAARALSVNGGAGSRDIVETLAARFADCARSYAHRVHSAGLDDAALVDAVHFVADLLVHSQVGTDVRWFDASLDAVLELAAPSRLRTPDAERFILTVARQLQR